MNLLESLRREMNEHGYGEDDIFYCRCWIRRKETKKVLNVSMDFLMQKAKIEPKAFLKAIANSEYDSSTSTKASVWRFASSVRVQMKDGSFIEWCIQSNYDEEGWEWHDAPDLSADDIEDVEPEMVVLR